jgi:hypothetical protein
VQPALHATTRLAPALRTTFRETDPIARGSGRTLPALDGVLASTRSHMHQLEPAGRQLVPILQLVALYRREVVASLANAASATQTTINGHHGLRILITLNSQAVFGQQTRQGAFRSNPYPAPGAILDLAQGRGAFTCRDAEHPTTLPIGAPPPCLAAKPWTFQGRTASYPRVQENRP